MRPVDLTWPGGEHPFLLTIPLLRALEAKCDAGPLHILGRLQSSTWRVDDVLETIRLGLEGGGMTKSDARKLVQLRVEDNLAACVLTADVIIRASVFGGFGDGDDDDDDTDGDVEDDEPGEA